mgnify:CR=1 FL=1|tara:strand:+ start:1494 stop:2105 length:612 start_codon:yes stop_codon:yes gene_type:complete
MINRTVILIFFIIISFNITYLHAENSSFKGSVNALEKLAKDSSESSEKKSKINRSNYIEYSSDEQVKVALRENFINKLKWNEWALEHEKEVYRQHAAESRYIFWMVFLLTGFSMFMVAWQFWIYSRKINIGSASGTHSEAAKGLTSGVFSISKSDGIKIDTPFIGAIILVITFFFLNSYLTNVYPIHKNDQEIRKSEKGQSGD